MATAFLLAWRSVQAGRGRFLGSVGGVAVSLVLVLFLVGVYAGVVGGTEDVVTSLGADVWVAQDEALDLVLKVSVVPRSLESRIRAVPGVGAVVPLYAASAHAHLFHEEGPSTDVFVVGFDPSATLGRPRDVVQGSADVGREGIVLSRALASREGLGLGDRLHVLDRTFTVVGVSETPALAMFTVAFIDADVARELFRFGDGVSYFLVGVAPGEDPAVVAAAVAERVGTTATAVTEKEFAAESSKVIREAFLPILAAIATIGFVVGAAVVGIATWSAVNERAADYGVLKAIGGEERDLYGVVFAEAILTAAAGFVAALVLYFALAAFIASALPTVPVTTEVRALALALPGAVTMALLAAWLPVRRVARIDAAETFRRAA